MEHVTRDGTCFIVAHRLSTVRDADIVVVFAEGRIEAVGKHDELSKSSETYRKLYGLHLTEKAPNPQMREDTGESYPMAVGQ